MSGWGEDSFSTPRKITFGHFRGDDFSGLLSPPLTGTDPPLTGTDPPEGRGGLRGATGVMSVTAVTAVTVVTGELRGVRVITGVVVQFIMINWTTTVVLSVSIL